MTKESVLLKKLAEIFMLLNLFSFLFFFGTVLLTTLLMTRYFYHKIMSAFPKTKLYRRELKLFYLPVFTVPFIFANKGIQGSFTITVMSYILYGYFTFIFIFFLWGLITEFFIRLRKLSKKHYSKKLSLKKRRALFFGLFIITFHTISSGFWMARDLKIEHLEIKTDKVDSDIRVVLLADTHFNQVSGLGFAKNIVETVAPLNPDLILHAGDFYDHSILDPAGTFEVMRKLQAPLGKYAVAGNHEYINKIESSEKYISDSGFTLIKNDSIAIGEHLILAAVTDSAAKRFGFEVPDDNEILRELDRSKFIIFLKHQPKFQKNTKEKFDLMLAGHTHAGQIFPFGLFVKTAFKYSNGTYNLPSGATIHVSRGTGTWGPPVRFGAAAEITVIDIIPSVK